MSNNLIKFDSCQDIVCDTIETTVDEEGCLFTVHAILRNVCCNTCMSVGVILYIDDCIYAIKLREVYTGNCKCGCCTHKNLTIPQFTFIFPKHLECCAHAEVVAHYIC
nr:hypothetical protein [uncultured Niameybacter sp.]